MCLFWCIPWPDCKQCLFFQRLEEERTALMERSEVVDDLRAMRLSSVS